MTISIAEALREGATTLDRAGLADARREASGVLEHVVSRNRTFLLTHPEHRLTDRELNSFRELLIRRASGEPLQYITSHQSFFGLDFEVAKGVLIPRPETELVVETALELLPVAGTKPTICDVGTGSGCIAIALLNARQDLRGVAIDISSAALEIAQRNAARLLADNRLTFVRSDCFSSLSPDEFAFDLIASNPPYVSQNELAGLQREVRDHEPLEALAGGGDGLDVVRRLLSESGPFLKPGCHLLIEIGFSQAEAVRSLVDYSVWTLEGIRPDLQGIPRIVALRKN